jgi:hypothetical protein
MEFCSPEALSKRSLKKDVSKVSIRQIERYRQLITNRIIKDTISRMRVFDMASKIKPKRLKPSEFHLNGLRVANSVIVDDDRLYRMGGFSDSE